MSAPSVIERVKTTLVALKMPRALEVLDVTLALAKAERDGALRERIRYYCRFALLIVDEIGYLPVTPGGGNLFFQLVNARYEKGAVAESGSPRALRPSARVASSQR